MLESRFQCVIRSIKGTLRLVPAGTEYLLTVELGHAQLPDDLTMAKAALRLRVHGELRQGDAQPGEGDDDRPGLHPDVGVPMRAVGTLSNREDNSLWLIDVGFPLEVELNDEIPESEVSVGDRVRIALKGPLIAYQVEVLP